MTEPVTLAGLIDGRRKHFKLTVRELAERTDMKQRTLESYLQGERGMPANVAADLLKALGMSVKDTAAAIGAVAIGETIELTKYPADATPDREPFVSSRHARNLPLAVREYLAEFRLRLTKGGATEEEIDEALELLRSPQVFTFYKGGALSEFSEEDVLRGMRAIGEGVVIPELLARGRKVT